MIKICGGSEAFLSLILRMLKMQRNIIMLGIIFIYVIFRCFNKKKQKRRRVVATTRLGDETPGVFRKWMKENHINIFIKIIHNSFIIKAKSDFLVNKLPGAPLDFKTSHSLKHPTTPLNKYYSILKYNLCLIFMF